MLHVLDLPLVAFIGAVPWAVVRLLTRAPVRRVAAESVFVGYVAAFVYVTLLLPLPASSGSHGFGWSAVNVIPTRTISGIIRDYRSQAIVQLLGNVVLFVPLGVLLPLLDTRFRRFVPTLVVGLAVSLGIELAQLVMLLGWRARRAVDIDDVVLNVMGVCVGYLLWRGAQVLARLRGDRRRRRLACRRSARTESTRGGRRT